jgi:glucokinase
MSDTGTAVIAVDIGGTTVKGAVFAADGTVLARTTVPTFGPSGAALDAVTSLIEQLAAAASTADHRVTGIGLCSPGLVDGDTGRIVFAANLGWTDLPLADLLAERFGVPVAVDHDARAAARAERAARIEAGLDGDEFVFVPIGTGIASTLFTEGRIVHGATGGAGEFGHIPVVPGGELCTCGQRGCVEIYASAGNILRRYRAAGGTASETTRDVAESIDTDPIAAAVWADAVAALATGTTILSALLDPTAIVIGGGLGEAGERLLGPLRAGVAAMLGWRTPPSIEQSLVGVGAGLAGAALLVRAAPVVAPATTPSTAP